MLKLVIKKILPPFVFDIYNYFRTKINGQNSLFEGDDKLFKKLAHNATVYGEYGCGTSTSWVLHNTDCEILSVDTSNYWVNETLKNSANMASRLSISFVDLGKLGNWGRPLSYEKKNSFLQYVDAIWEHKKNPDFVLIDGRFRVCCFLNSLKKAKQGTFILFDDYLHRQHYHVVEHFLKPVKIFGRQALFVVPEKTEIDMDKLETEIMRFLYVFD